jgi:hypothetical protein
MWLGSTPVLLTCVECSAAPMKSVRTAFGGIARPSSTVGPRGDNYGVQCESPASGCVIPPPTVGDQ